MHKEWCIKSAILKKHILVEKPATLKLSDIEEIINAVKLNNVFFAEGLTFRYHPFFLQILSTIKKIHPNKIKHISASFGNDAIGGKKIFGLRLKRPNKNKVLLSLKQNDQKVYISIGDDYTFDNELEFNKVLKSNNIYRSISFYN